MINLFKFKFYLSTLFIFFGIIGLVYEVYFKPVEMLKNLSKMNMPTSMIATSLSYNNSIILYAILLLSGSFILAFLKEPNSK